MTSEKILAEKLLDIGAVKLNVIEPFTWASGWKSPIYCDNRKILSYPVIRDLVKTEMSAQIFNLYSDVDMIAGVATAGIPHGVLVADLLKLSYIYVRNKPKVHGLTNQIEGDITQGKNVILIEDLVSTGGSSLACVDAVRAAGLNVVAMFSVFTYGFPHAQKAFESYNLPLHSLTNYNVLVELAQEKNLIKEEHVISLNTWRQNPETWNG